MFHKGLLFLFSRFALTGVIANGLGYGLFSILFYVTKTYFLSLILSYVFFLILNFRFQALYVFKVKAPNSVNKLKYALIYIICFIFNALFLFLIEEAHHELIYYAQFFYLVLNSLVIFPILKKFIFSG